MVSVPDARPRWVRVAALGVMAAGMPLAAGCGGHDSKVVLPPASSASPSTVTTTPSPSPSPATTKDAVVTAYKGTFLAVNQALQAPAERIRSILSGYVTGDFLDFQVRQLVDQQARHLEPWGNVVVHVTKVDVRGDKATVRDCQDASHAGLADARTHQLIAGSRGSAHRNLRAELTRGGDGRWRVSDLRQFKATCQVP